MKTELTSLEKKELFPRTCIDRDYKKFREAGYEVKKSESEGEGSMYLQVYDPNVDILEGYIRRVEFEYDGTGNLLTRMSVFHTPIILDTQNDKKVF